MSNQNGPFPENARKPTFVFFIMGTIVAIVFSGVHGYQVGWKWGLLLLCTAVALLSAAAGLMFAARWASLITIISLVGTLISFKLSPPWDTTPSPITPQTFVDGKEYKGTRTCWFDQRVEDPTKGYTCYLTVEQSLPVTTTTPQSAPAK